MATKQFQKTHQEMARAKVTEWIGDQGLDDAASGYWGRLARGVTIDAAKHAEANNLSTEEWGEFHDLLSDTLNVVDAAMLAVNGGWVANNAEIKGWKHHRHVTEVALRVDAPVISRDSLEDASAAYLDLPFRSAEMDYLLVELLIACELFSYARQMSSALKRTTFWGWAKARLYSAIFWFALVLAARWLFDAKWGTVVFWIYGAESVLSTIVLFRPSKTVKLLQEMNGVYCELAPSGPYSARHIEHRARTAADRGVVWPAPLFALLDDIISRGGRF